MAEDRRTDQTSGISRDPPTQSARSASSSVERPARREIRDQQLEVSDPAVDLWHYVQIPWRLWAVASAAYQRVRVGVGSVTGHYCVIEVIDSSM